MKDEVDNYNLFDELPRFIEEEILKNERREKVKFLFDQFYIAGPV